MPSDYDTVDSVFVGNIAAVFPETTMISISSRGDVYPRDLIPAPGQLHGVASGSAAHVQNTAPRRKAQLLKNKIYFRYRVFGEGVVHI